MMKRIMVVLVIIYLFVQIAFSQNVTFDNLPLNLQLYPRDDQDSSEVIISGTVTATGHDSLMVIVYKDNQLVKSLILRLAYSGNSSPFSLHPKIHAEQAEYGFKVYLDTTLIAQRDSIVCGDVYLINGQSNALAIDYEGLATYTNEWLRSFGSSSQTPAQCSADLKWSLAQGHEHSAHAAVGVWGLRLGRLLVEHYDIPICLLNGATGGSYIADHLRNNNKPADLNTNYGRLLYRTQRAKIQQGIKAIFWYQGEMNTDRTYSSYVANFDLLRNAWEKDFASMEKIYLFQIRPTEGELYQSQLREAQRQIAAQYPDVEIMSTCGVPGHDGLHYNFKGYNTIAEWIFPLVARDFYGSIDTLYITPPNILEAFFTTDAKNELAIIFDQDIIWPADTLGASLKNYFYLSGGNTVTVDSGYIQDGNTVILRLSASSTAINLTYLPAKYYNGKNTIYQGPWLKNPRGISALSFCAVPVLSVRVTNEQSVMEPPGQYILYRNYPNPFNSLTIIPFDIPKPGHVVLKIFDTLGREVATILDKTMAQGYHQVLFDGANLSSGSYFYRLTIENKLYAGKMIFLK